MKTNSAFIVRGQDNTIRIVTEGALAKDILSTYGSMFDEPIKTSLVKRLAAEAIISFSGVSTNQEVYENSLRECATILHEYITISLIGFGNLLTKAHSYDEMMSKNDVVPEAKEE